MSASDDTIVAELRARSSVNGSLVYAHLVYAEVDGLIRRYGGRSGSILEIGPGANLGALFCFVASHYTNVAGVDIAAAEPPATGFYSSLCDYLSCVGSWRWWRQFATASFPNCYRVDVTLSRPIVRRSNRSSSPRRACPAVGISRAYQR
jgi:hypothetical protein